MISGRNHVIDAFRGVAVLSVMAYHYLLEWAPASGVAFPGMAWLALGKLGVDLFFVISGLVIAMTVLRVGSAREFVIRRLARLYPAFLVSATLVFVTLSLVDPLRLRVGIGDYLANWTMLAGDLGFRYVDGIFWTLAVEVKFYAWVALAWLILRKRFWMGVAAVGLAGALVSSFSPLWADHLLIARYMPFFLFGMAGWYALAERRASVALPLGLLAALLYLLRAGQLAPSPGLAIAAHLFMLLATGLMFALMALRPTLKGGPLAFVGRVSYSLYLVHQYLGVTAIHLLVRGGLPAPLAIGVIAAASVALAWLMHSRIEGPGQRWVVRRLLVDQDAEHRPGQQADTTGDKAEPHRLPMTPCPAPDGSPG